MLILLILLVLLALATTFYIGVWRGVDNTPIWIFYIGMAIMAFGGGVAINLILGTL